MEDYDGTQDKRENAGEYENLRNQDIITNTREVEDMGVLLRGGEGQDSEDLNEVNKFMEQMVIEEGSLDDSSYDSTQPQLNYDSTQSYYTLNVSIYHYLVFIHNNCSICCIFYHRNVNFSRRSLSNYG